jgi:hypothetical protein
MAGFVIGLGERTGRPAHAHACSNTCTRCFCSAACTAQPHSVKRIAVGVLNTVIENTYRCDQHNARFITLHPQPPTEICVPVPAPHLVKGDRHLGNMLLDKSSAAVLQIDLGVAFEQGMFLNTPETVGENSQACGSLWEGPEIGGKLWVPEGPRWGGAGERWTGKGHGSRCCSVGGYSHPQTNIGGLACQAALLASASTRRVSPDLSSVDICTHTHTHAQTHTHARMHTHMHPPHTHTHTNTPTTHRQVPFRLTRDVVDGMGAFGVEGPMRRCCEETLRVGAGRAQKGPKSRASQT